MNYIEVNENNISELIEKFKIVVLDFYADWCGPCRSFAPTYYKVSTKYPEVLFGKINVDHEQLLSSDFNIRSVPTIVVLKDQTIIFEKSGPMFEHSLIALIEEVKKVDVTQLPNYEDE